MRVTSQRLWPRHGGYGFSALELVVALSLAALAVIGVLGLVRMTTRAAWVVESRLDAQQHARRAVERLTEEL
ncbi:MAG: hypothetical protein HY355_00485, partial [Armatimonadetes bacterium]|nr:hypothetical protein [Armatimonadota bacterium]